MDSKGRYFIAIIPQGACFNHAHQLKTMFSQKFNSKASLNSPPHITLHMPFMLPLKKEAQVIEMLDIHLAMLSVLQIQLKGFGHFNERVIFAKVIKTEELQQLYQEIRLLLKRNFNIYNADYKQRGFNPHLTLAFRDLKKEAFYVSWKKLKSMNFDYENRVKSVCLLKHDGMKWHELHHSPLGIN